MTTIIKDKKISKKDRMCQRITKHGNDLLMIFPKARYQDPIELSKKLHSLEVVAHRLSTDYCNGVVTCEQWEAQGLKIIDKARTILGLGSDNAGIILNGDARGYALKIDDDYVAKHSLQLYRDW